MAEISPNSAARLMERPDYFVSRMILTVVSAIVMFLGFLVSSVVFWIMMYGVLTTIHASQFLWTLYWIYVPGTLASFSIAQLISKHCEKLKKELEG